MARSDPGPSNGHWILAKNGLAALEEQVLVVAVRSHDMQEHLAQSGLAARALHDPDLGLLHEAAVLHDLIERLDLERRIQEPIVLPRIQRDAVMQSIGPQIGVVVDPVADLGAKRMPEREVWARAASRTPSGWAIRFSA